MTYWIEGWVAHKPTEPGRCAFCGEQVEIRCGADGNVIVPTGRCQACGNWTTWGRVEL